MFSVEMDFDEVAIRVVDDGGHYEDVTLFLYDDIVYIRQWNDELDQHKYIEMSVDMWAELVEALNKSEGVFVRR